MKRETISGLRTGFGQGFTIVELLVVITVITLMVSLLIPVLGRAKDVSTRVACQSMYRQLNVSAATYAGDNKDAVPWLNSGSYGSLGIAGPEGSAAAIDTDNFATFTRDYLNAVWAYDPGTTYMKVPKAIVCPGMVMTKQIHSWMPGNPTGLYAMGEATWGGSIVGFGSFLGLMTDVACSSDRSGSGFIGMNGGYRSKVATAGPTIGQGSNLLLRMQDFLNPSDDVIFLDPVMYGRGQWNAPHGNGISPSGNNQGYPDGSVRFYGYTTLNYGYQPCYPWDRQVYTPMYVTPKSLFNQGGYPTQEWGWQLPTPDWYGATTPCAAGTFVPF